MHVSTVHMDLAMLSVASQSSSSTPPIAINSDPERWCGLVTSQFTNGAVGQKWRPASAVQAVP